LRHCDHSLLVGEGALTFARQQGFPEEDLLTESSRAAWQRWIEAGSPSHKTTGPLSDEDRWARTDTHGDRPDFPTTTGTGSALLGPMDVRRWARARPTSAVTVSGWPAARGEQANRSQ